MKITSAEWTKARAALESLRYAQLRQCESTANTLIAALDTVPADRNEDTISTLINDFRAHQRMANLTERALAGEWTLMMVYDEAQYNGSTSERHSLRVLWAQAGTEDIWGDYAHAIALIADSMPMPAYTPWAFSRQVGMVYDVANDTYRAHNAR